MAFDFIKRIFNPEKVEIALSDIQSLILRSRPIPYYGTVALIEIREASAGKALIKAMLPLISSAENWHLDLSASVFISFTYKGLQALGLPENSLASFPESFKQGMVARSSYLYDIGDNDPKNWERAFLRGNIHITAAIIANTEEEWLQKLKEFKEAFGGNSNIHLIESLDFGATEEMKNVFGFRDGISNPEIEGSGIDNPPGYDKPIKTGEFILGYPGESGIIKQFPQPEILGKNGSFLIFRKYQSQVAEFNKFIKDNSNTAEEGELLAAKLVGRWRSGAPLVLAPEKDDIDLGTNAQRNNNFSYKDDQLGKKCPFGAHARRMNPRNSKSFILEDERLHRIIRRAVSFGDIVPPEETRDDGKERGQFFIGISADAMGTLEFLQKQWANNGNSVNLGDEKDPMIGVQRNGLFTCPGNPLVKRYHNLQTFNIVKGGEYCFIPSISALKWISELS
ncbi:Dyp-type peroxidase [Chryseobacterium sp. KMC2]|uniref:Dyp-type peroxidase n=1 Tax=Chryseobacterium sp. KMC2 TaxID=2800705 RepID=UPI001924AA56|nr:Dyp-type peroxidase [Chryseobacterium sp. KMC2]MBL3547276.1 Dyp-type peroxidase [Chryseobacterium sp. KMC2]